MLVPFDPVLVSTSPISEYTINMPRTGMLGVGQLRWELVFTAETVSSFVYIDDDRVN